MNNLFLYALFLFQIFSYACQPQKNHLNNYISIDTIQYVILKYDTFIHRLDDNFKNDFLTIKEINLLKELLEKAAKEHNEVVKNKAFVIMPLMKYKMQFFPVTNAQGQKEVWINCLCQTYNDDWKNRVIMVEDGGNCYFSIKINLTTKSYSQLMINGSA
jgi:hypothetical protein